MSAKDKKDKRVIGWREWVKLPELGISWIKVKVDTGARSSSLHSFDEKFFTKKGRDYVTFKIYPNQKDTKKKVTTTAEIIEYRKVKSSNGHVTERPVILTDIELLGEIWQIEVTLSSRDEMGFRMLLGRESFRDRMLVDARQSFFSKKPKRKRRS